MKQLRSCVLVLTILLLYACKEETPEKKQSEDTFPKNEITLTDLSDFKQTESNWQIAGNVYADRNKELAMQSENGTGILVNLPDDNNKAHLFTQFEHVDLDIELEVMLPKGSNSGIYLMSRYEVQLFDSWGVDTPQYSDIGGIYQRWDESKPEAEKGYDGIAPKLNAAKAPGLWQSVKIVFRAPRFNSNGEKISNAVFKEVYLNGTLIQEDAEVTGPTRAAAFEDEVDSAPLMIQGDHGPIAFRNIKYKKYNGHQVSLANITLKQYPSSSDTIKDFLSQQPSQNIKTDTISYLHATERENYLLYYEGEMNIPDDGDYIFSMQLQGGGFLIVGEDTLLKADGDHTFSEKFYIKKDIKAGKYPFKFVYNKHGQWWRRSMALFVEGDKTARQPLHAPGSIFEVKPANPINILADDVITQRSFIMHKDVKRTHVISIGSPVGIHYSYDMSSGTFLQAWHGGFLNASQMWFERGEPQLAKPLGPKVEFYAGPAVAILNNDSDNWPNEIWLDKPYKHEGYSLDENGYPSFKMKVGDVSMSDKITPDTQEHKFIRNIKLGKTVENTYVKLAEGKEIEQLPDGTYAINDKEYYLTIDKSEGGNMIVRNTGSLKELLFKAEGGVSDIIYETIW